MIASQVDVLIQGVDTINTGSLQRLQLVVAQCRDVGDTICDGDGSPSSKDVGRSFGICIANGLDLSEAELRRRPDSDSITKIGCSICSKLCSCTLNTCVIECTDGCRIDSDQLRNRWRIGKSGITDVIRESSQRSRNIGTGAVKSDAAIGQGQCDLTISGVIDRFELSQRVSTGDTHRVGGNVLTKATIECRIICELVGCIPYRRISKGSSSVCIIDPGQLVNRGAIRQGHTDVIPEINPGCTDDSVHILR